MHESLLHHVLAFMEENPSLVTALQQTTSIRAHFVPQAVQHVDGIVVAESRKPIIKQKPLKVR